MLFKYVKIHAFDPFTMLYFSHCYFKMRTLWIKSFSISPKPGMNRRNYEKIINSYYVAILALSKGLNLYPNGHDFHNIGRRLH